MDTPLFPNDLHKCNYHILQEQKQQRKQHDGSWIKGLVFETDTKALFTSSHSTHTESDLQSACVILASLTFWSVVRLLMRTVIICRGMCWTRLARAMEGSNEGSEMTTNTLYSDYEVALYMISFFDVYTTFRIF